MSAIDDAGIRVRAGLERIEAAWRRQGAPIVDVLAPGLSEDEVAEQLATRGLAASPEVVAWFGWHNGLTRRPAVAGELWSYYQFLTIEECLVDLDWWVTLGEEMESPWEHGWLPLLTQDSILFVLNTSPGPHGGRIRYMAGGTTWFDKPDPAGPGGVSLAEFTVWWAEALESGGQAWDAQSSRWVRRGELLPQLRQRTWLI